MVVGCESYDEDDRCGAVSPKCGSVSCASTCATFCEDLGEPVDVTTKFANGDARCSIAHPQDKQVSTRASAECASASSASPRVPFCEDLGPIDVITRFTNGDLTVAELGFRGSTVDVEGAVKLGVGSLGDVFLAKDSNGVDVAVKAMSMKRLLEAKSAPGSRPEDRVRREVRTLQELNHPNIVKIEDVFLSSSLPATSREPPYLCIVMDYVADSAPLSLSIRRSMSVVTVLGVLKQLASALLHMHDRHFVHRDVWSENVLITRDGRAVLIDLGCAARADGPHQQDDLNMPYLSPEAARGKRQHPSDDCFSCGLLITEMITGRFVSDRMNRSDMPMCFLPQKLKDAVSECCARGGPVVSKICQGLLQVQAHRLMMEDVLVEVSRERRPARLSTPHPNVQSTRHLCPRLQKQSSSPAFTVGQRILYTPRTEGIPRQWAVVGSRNLCNTGWIIHLNGCCKEVEDADAWRMAPSCEAGLPSHIDTNFIHELPQVQTPKIAPWPSLLSSCVRQFPMTGGQQVHRTLSWIPPSACAVRCP